MFGLYCEGAVNGQLYGRGIDPAQSDPEWVTILVESGCSRSHRSGLSVGMTRLGPTGPGEASTPAHGVLARTQAQRRTSRMTTEATPIRANTTQAAMYAPWFPPEEVAARIPKRMASTPPATAAPVQ